MLKQIMKLLSTSLALCIILIKVRSFQPTYNHAAASISSHCEKSRMLLHSTKEKQDLDETKQSSFFYSKKDFIGIGMGEIMSGVLNSLNLDRPSKIQALSFNELYLGSNCILADQTGSGKTLAYLLPVLQRLLELQRNKTISSPEERAPYVVVITPTTELALQVSKVVKSLAHILKFRTACVTATSDMDAEQKKLRLGSDILISTPGRIIALMEKEEISFRRVQCCVLDEADVLFMDESFPLQPIGAACPQDTQFVFVTATLPEIVTEQITREFPGVSFGSFYIYSVLAWPDAPAPQFPTIHVPTRP